MLGEHGRSVTSFIFAPIVNLLYKAKISPNAVTLVGSFLNIIVALIFIPFGYGAAGAIILGVLLFADSVDGLLARKIGNVTEFGAFLDSCMDRIVDGVVFACIAFYTVFYIDGYLSYITFVLSLALMVFSSVVPYTRAKGATYGVEPKKGLAERTDRLVISLVALGLTDFGLGTWILLVALLYLVIATIYTSYIRMLYVYKNLDK